MSEYEKEIVAEIISEGIMDAMDIDTNSDDLADRALRALIAAGYIVVKAEA